MPSSWVISKENIPIDYPKQWFSTGDNFFPLPTTGDIWQKSRDMFGCHTSGSGGAGRDGEEGGCYWHPAAGIEAKNATKHPMTCSPHSKEFSGPKC